MTRRRAFSFTFRLPLALLSLMLMAAPAWAQSRIYWSMDLSNGAKEVWSMSPDGTDKVNLFPAGLVPPAPYDKVERIAGPSAGSYPLDPSIPGSPSARWWLAVVSGPVSPYTALFAFAPNGQGAAVWRPLTDIPRESGPGVVVLVTGLWLELPTGPGDGFASFQIIEAIFDGVAWTQTDKLVRFADPFTRPAGTVGLDQLETLVSGGPGSFHGAHTWSPDGRTLAYIGRNLYPDGSSRSALRLLDTATGADVSLLDTTSGVQANRPRWSPDGGEIAFDSNISFNAASGTYAVNVSSGAIRPVVTAGNSSDFFTQPVWSPDRGSLALVKYYNGPKVNQRDRGTIMRVPSAGVTKKNPPVALTPTFDPYRRPILLGWR